MRNIVIPLIGAVALLICGSTFAANPYWEPNNSWISISGTVEEVKANQFLLNYGNGKVTVEMDDGDRDADAYKLLKGDKVTVTGFIDRDLFEKTKVEAGSVYVENIGTTFYASAMDEEDPYFTYFSIYHPVSLSTSYLYGTVTSVDDKSFTLDTGMDKFKVNVKGMSFNPLDEKGYVRIEKGDRVSVQGALDENFFKNREFNATTMVSFSEHSKKRHQKNAAE